MRGKSLLHRRIADTRSSATTAMPVVSPGARCASTARVPAGLDPQMSRRRSTPNRPAGIRWRMQHTDLFNHRRRHSGQGRQDNDGQLPGAAVPFLDLRFSRWPSWLPAAPRSPVPPPSTCAASAGFIVPAHVLYRPKLHPSRSGIGCVPASCWSGRATVAAQAGHLLTSPPYRMPDEHRLKRRTKTKSKTSPA